MTNKYWGRLTATVSTLALISSSLAVSNAYAQSADEAISNDIIVVTGARGAPRTVADSAVPIDVIGQEELESVSFVDTNDVLKTLVPSYTIGRQPISDGATFIRPASLRGLPTDKTLVLVNSKRRHRAALVSIGGSGTQGPDIATIPATALKTVEVLRDGAAAQYGTDAIAGVINFILKDNSEGITLTTQVGQYYEGDGGQYLFAGNAGFSLGDKGFISVSGEYSNSDATVRAEQYCEPWACVDPSGDSPLSSFVLDPSYFAGLSSANIGSGDVVQPWGAPQSEAYRLFYNAGYEVTDDIELYSFGNYSWSKGDGSFFYRYAGNGTIEDLRQAEGSIYNPLSKFPGGFTPRFFGEIFDFSVLGGAKGTLGGTFTWDISGRYGTNEIQYTLANTINPSLGAASPTSFRPGDLENTELQVQADFGFEVDAGLYSPLSISFGASYLDETYEVQEGQVSSYIAGPHATPDPFGFCTATDGSGVPTAAGLAVIGSGSTLDCSDPSDPAFAVVGVGSNGFPGYSPTFSDEYTRDSFAGYVEMSADVTEKWLLQAAGRIEAYSDFDTEVIWKVASQYDAFDSLSLRGSVSTGFRAPTPGQQGTTNVSTRLPNGFPVATGLFPASGPIAQALGATPLQPETSMNYTVGLVGDFGPVGFTVDFYRIDIDDRTYAISTRDVSTDPTSGVAYDNFLALQAAGVVGAESIGGVLYFTNAFDTKTQGVDIVLTSDADFGDFGTTDFIASINYNKTEFSGGDPSSVLNTEDLYDFENDEPNWRGVFTAAHSVGDFNIVARANYFGGYSNFGAGNVQTFKGETFFDLDVTYSFTDWASITVGARNIFDNYPDPGDDAIGDTCCGRVYRSDSIVDWQGGFYYTRLNFDL